MGICTPIPKVGHTPPKKGLFSSYIFWRELAWRDLSDHHFAGCIASFCGGDSSRLINAKNQVTLLLNRKFAMTRPYNHHPGLLPDRAAARARWIQRSGFKPRGHEPYQHHPERARAGDFPFEERVEPRVGESLAHLMVRLQDSGKISKLAAFSTAAGLLGHEELQLEAGRRAVFSAELHAHRTSAEFKRPPSPIRGDLSKCRSQEDFRDINPSVAVRLSALVGLQWSANLRSSDIFLVWLWVAYVAQRKDIKWEIKALKRVFKLHRPWDNFRRVIKGKFKVSGQVSADSRSEGLPIVVNRQLNPALLESLLPDGSGENYAYLELYTLSKATASWQEQAIRGLLAAAVRARIYWSHGGRVFWNLSLDEAKSLFSLPGGSLDRLKKERLSKLKNLLNSDQEIDWKTLEGTGGRLWFDWNFQRDQARRGAPCTGVKIDVRISPAPTRECPKSDYSRARTEDRKRREIPINNIDGIEIKTTAQKARSEAAKKGWIKRRTVPPKRDNREDVVLLPSKAELDAARQEIWTFEGAPIIEAPAPVERMTMDEFISALWPENENSGPLTVEEFLRDLPAD